MALSDEVKAQVSLVETVAPLVEWDLRKSRPVAGDWWAACPLHGEKSASFHVTETGGAGGQFYCFGCGARGSVIDFVMAAQGLDFGAAVKSLASSGGVARSPDPARAARVQAEAQARRIRAERDASRRAEAARNAAWAIWREAAPDTPQLAEYLQGRGIRLDLISGVPATLRFCPDLPVRDGSGIVAHSGPAMVAAIGRRGRFVGVHRTWIDGPARARWPDGRKIEKQMLGQTGAIFGQPVMLCPPDPAALLVVGEGIETTLAYLAAARRRRPGLPVVAEAALTLGALCGAELAGGSRAGEVDPDTGRALPGVAPDPDKPGWLPAGPRQGAVVVLADPSRKAPQTAERHAQRAVAKLKTRGFRAGLSVPRGSFAHDDDFADLAKNGDLYDEETRNAA